MTHVRVVTPITADGFTDPGLFESIASDETTVSHVSIERGPASIEGEFEEALAIPDTLAKMLDAERDGVDAIVIDCLGDPGLAPGREALDTLVLGPCQTGMHVAAMLAHNFSLVTVLPTLVPFFESLAIRYGLIDRLVSVRSVDIPVLELEADLDRCNRALLDESVKAIEEDGAHAIILGCTGMKGCAAALDSGLARRGYGDVPVIDPMLVTFKIAEALAGIGLKQSKRTYPSPGTKEITGFDYVVREQTAAV
jgi:allantoin racemase